MKKLRVRSYALLGLLTLLLLPWIFFLAVLLITTQSVQLGTDRQHSYMIVIPHVAAFAGLLLAFFLVGIRLRRLLLAPLEKLSAASRQIAEGDWDVRLTPSAIREIADVQAGFEAMASGLADSHRKQAELEEQRRFVIAAVAHDLRTPLFALRGYLDGLEQGIARTPEQAAKYVAVCKAKSAQLDRLVEDLFAFAKLDVMDEAAADTLRTADLRAIARQSIDSVMPQASAKRIEIAADCDDADGVAVLADAHMLERAIINLLDNAVRHTPAQGRIEVSCRREGDRVVFAVRDTGDGFAHDELTRVFEPLFRGEQSRNRATGGAGLGLAIAQRIIRRHGGELAASNRPEGGAVVTGWLPAADPAAG
ncbi:sensor histidine kinase [Paenibacillus methanolicus]|uniref:histidine kinase n=1 Tax=Paenibacillus methanolicus TaxID=582686 RepID=A0A5S5C4Y5_9BACL|nr:HAMP domain-containing sensor histidine kinase [Paenibacillus methanolicus]TYP73390.1 signal transduction histidine kinase [Paenibacillus methanolicus]